MRRNWSGWLALGLVVAVARVGVAVEDDTPASPSNDLSFTSASDGGGSNCAESNCTEACCIKCGTWYGGIEGMYLHASRDPSAIALSPERGVLSGSSIFDSSYGDGAQGWVGFQNCAGWGVRTRFSNFADEQSVLNNVERDYTNGTYGLRAYTIDLELTKAIESGCWSFEGAFGLRYARLEQDQTVIVTGTEAETAFASRHINGTGFTSFFEGRRAVGNCGWSLFANVRGSVLWGSDYGADGGMINTTPFPFGSEAKTLSNTLYVVETQVGAEWTHPVECLRATFFLRGAYEFQQWTAANNLGLGYTFPTTFGSFHAAPESVNVVLNGVAFSAGLRY